MPPLLSARDVSVEFGGHPVLHGVNLDVEAGSSCAIVGGSNSGKSTLVKVLAGLLPPTRGEVLFRGQRVRSHDPMGVPWLEGIGYVSQNLGLRSNMTVMDNVLLPLLYHGRIPPDEARERVRALLARLEITEVNERPSSLAPGEAELVALARALVQEPVLLLFDNPVVVVDVDCADRVIDLLRELRSHGLAVVSTSSSEAVASVMADAIRRLREGRMEEL